MDFTAAGAANDFFHTFSNFITGKSILSTILSYATVAGLVLLLIIILLCIVRTLRQNTQKLVTEIHLAVLKNIKGGDAGSQHTRSHPLQGREEKTRQAGQIRTSGISKSCPGAHLKDDLCLSDACYIRLLPNFCDAGRRPSPISFQTEST